MVMLDDVIGSAVPKGSLAKPRILALGALLASGVLFKGSGPADSGKRAPAAPQDDADGGLLGGLGGVLNRFQHNGLGDQVASWLRPGQDEPVAPRQDGSARERGIVQPLEQ